MTSRITIGLIVALSSVASAGPPLEPSVEPGPAVAADRPSAADWDAAPLATEASGIERGADEPSKALWIGRAILFIPKWGLIALASPVRLAAWTYERYQLRDRLKQVFFNVDGTFGVFPVAFFETRFGLNIGARLVHKDLFGRQERLRVRAGFGGEFEQVVEAKMGSGDRFGDALSLELEAHYQRRPNNLFYGIGDGADAPEQAGTMIDALTDSTSVPSRFRQDVARFVLRSEIALGERFSLLPSGALMFRHFDVSDEAAPQENIAQNYDVETLPGFTQGVSNVYGELELRYDSRERASVYWTEAVNGTGWLLSGYVGWQEGVGNDRSGFLRYGGDVQRFIDLYGGSRILALRVVLDAVGKTGGILDEVPFTDLPRLGGARLLRGHDPNRFRDRIATLASAEYSWDLGTWAAAVLFVDVGRPFRVWRDVELSGWHLGYGVALQIHTTTSFLGRLSLATNTDRDVFFTFSFDPVYNRDERAGRF